MGEWQGHHSRAPKNGRNPALICTDTSKQTGKRCGRYKTPGYDYCVVHQASRPRNQLDRLAKLETNHDLSVDEMERRLRDPVLRKRILDSDLIRMAQMTADRIGLVPGSKVEVHRTSDLVPRVLEMLEAGPPPLSAKALESVSITSLNRQGDSQSPNRKPSAQAHTVDDA